MAEMKYPWKVAWITGASGAICGEMARRLADQGVRVAATPDSTTPNPSVRLLLPWLVVSFPVLLFMFWLPACSLSFWILLY